MSDAPQMMTTPIQMVDALRMRGAIACSFHPCGELASVTFAAPLEQKQPEEPRTGALERLNSDEREELARLRELRDRAEELGIA